jgi:predicted RecB family nuclease
MPKAKKKGEEKKVETKAAELGQIADIVEIEGIGAEYAKDLKKVGIKTTEDLRKISLIEIAEVTGITPKLLYKWQCMADLFRVRRAAEEYTDVLLEMEIETVKELSKQNANELFERVKKFVEKAEKKPGWHGDVNKAPSKNDVETWITHAKEIVKKKK